VNQVHGAEDLDVNQRDSSSTAIPENSEQGADCIRA